MLLSYYIWIYPFNKQTVSSGILGKTQKTTTLHPPSNTCLKCYKTILDRRQWDKTAGCLENKIGFPSWNANDPDYDIGQVKVKT